MKKTILLLALVLTALQGWAQNKEVFSTANGALDGYDAVAYFAQKKAVKGTAAHSVQWKEATWYFSTKKNLLAFKANPEKYAPQYGGYCAYGAAEGHKAPTDPATWSVVDNKLYFNYNPEVKQMWNKNQNGLIAKANMQWPKIKSDQPE
jgi:YHS domain-containing protein